MTSTWAVSFLAAAVAALVSTPLLRRLAVRLDFVDQPGPRKSHDAPMPYLGGLAMMAGTAAGTAVGPSAGARAALLVGGAGLLGLLGLIDDKRNLGAFGRLGGEIGMAAAAYGLGVRAVATGIEPLDALITIVWIAGITNAFNFLDNMDGLAAGTGLACGLSIFALGAVGGQYRIATIAVALAAACLGFLASNFRPAVIFMGDSGALFVGFLVATLTLQAAPELSPPVSFLVPLLLVAVPVLDATTVIIGRLRHGLSPMTGGKDHLSHRLVTRGLSRERAVGLLFASQLALGLLAAAIGTRNLPVAVGLLAAVLIFTALAVFAVPGRMYRNAARPLPRKVRLAATGVGALAIVCSVPAVIALIEVRGPLQLAAVNLQEAVAAGRAGDIETATDRFALAEAQFSASESALSGPFRSLGLAVPGLSSNLRAARTLAASGSTLSAAGVHITRSANPDEVRVTDGTIDLAAVAALSDDLERATSVLDETLSSVRRVDHSYLVPQVRDAIERLERELARADADAAAARQAAAIAPQLLGGDGPQRYFLAVQNNAEARATGGFIGNFGEVVAENGSLRVDRFGRIGELNPTPGAPDRTLDTDDDFEARYGRFDITRTWQNINLSPDLRTVTELIAQLYPQSGGRPIDGVIMIDPVGLAALLELTGPLSVAPWPEPISAANVVEVTLRAAYVRFPVQEERVEFLGDVSEQVIRTTLRGALGTPPQIVQTLAPAVRDGHLRVATTDEEISEVLNELGLSGAIEPAESDSLFLTTQNAAGNKLDLYLQREVSYDVTLRPSSDGVEVEVDATAAVRLANDLPDAALPVFVTGPYDPRFTAGENRSFVSLYSPLPFQGARLQGEVTGLEFGRELDLNVYSTFVSIPADEELRLEVDISGRVPAPAGWYRLDLVPQPAVRPERFAGRWRVADGWRIVDARGGPEVSDDGRSATFEADLSAPLEVALRLERIPEASLWKRLIWPGGH